MSLCRTTESKHKCSPKQLCLCFVHLFLRLEDSVDKFLVRDLSVEMLLNHAIAYLELGVLEKFLSGPCPDKERWIPVVGNIETYKFGTG